MIGYYVHHQGRGHLHRAAALAPHLSELTVLSSLPEPRGWSQGWVELARDDDGDGTDRDETAHGRLHWVPTRDAGLRRRMAAISRWIERERPTAMVVDVSAEVTLLARLHGIPVVVVAQPGDRTDPAHRLAHDVASVILAPWPGHLDGALQMSADAAERLARVGAMSRFDSRERPATFESRSVVVLDGAGGQSLDAGALDAAQRSTPAWRWTVLGRGRWVEDPWPLLCAAEVVVTHAGQNAVAEVAAARRPAIVVPQARPHDEQRHLCEALAGDGALPAVVVDDLAQVDWPALLARTSALDGTGWRRWNDGAGAARAADLVRAVAR